MGRYSDEKVREALVALALAGSPAEVAATTGVPAATLVRWRDRDHVALYGALRREVVPRIHERIAQMQEEVAARASYCALMAVEEVEKQIALGHVRDASVTASRLQSIAASAIERMLPLRNRPTTIVEHRDTNAILRRLQELAGDAITVRAETLAVGELEAGE